MPGLVLAFTALQFSHDHLTHIAIGTSLATIIVTSSASAWAHHQHKAVHWLLVWRLLPGIIVGAIIGALFADSLSSDSLHQLFGLLLVILAIKLLLNLSPKKGHFTPHKIEMPVVGTLIGSLASCLGISGGVLAGPYFILRGQPLRRALATASAVGVPIALTGTISFIITGSDTTGLPAMSSGYVYWPAFATISAATLVCAPIGARLAYKLNPVILKKAFALLLIVIGITMLFG